MPDKQFQGVMLVNPGGPGGSGRVLSVLQGFVPGGAGRAYDWIGSDPRGVGSSTPALSCIPDCFHGTRPDCLPTSGQTWLEPSARCTKACGWAGGALLDHLKTTDHVRDMDATRVALGQRQINFYGFSYGTYLGQVHATLFPTHLPRAVLDSNVDPRKLWYQANLDQDIAFDRNIRLLLRLGRAARQHLPPGHDPAGRGEPLVRRAGPAAALPGRWRRRTGRMDRRVPGRRLRRVPLAAHGRRVRRLGEPAPGPAGHRRLPGR